MSAVLGPGKFFQTWVPKSEKEGAQAIADNVPEYRTEVVGDSGVLVSPGFPNAYEHGLNEVMTVTLDSAGTQFVNIKLTCNLETDGGYGCVDYVLIENTTTKYCGLNDKTFNLQIAVYDKTWTVTFISNRSISYDRGFRIDYYMK